MKEARSRQQMAQIPVRIDENGIVQDRQVNIKKSQLEEVKWIAINGGGPWNVVFNKNGTPFGSSSFYVDRGQAADSGESTVPPRKEPYRYSVTDGSGNLKDDPDVIVDP